MSETPPIAHSTPSEHALKARHLREQTYLPDEQAPYHGVSHPDRVWAKAQLLMDRCAAHGIAVDGEALRYAVELHDALSHIPPRLLGQDSPERVSANLTYRFLMDCGYPEASAVKISDIIMATNPDVRPTTTEGITIRAADIWNVGASYQEFKEGSLALHREAEIAKQSEVPFSHWIRGAFLYLERFMWPMLELTPNARDSDRRSVFHTNAVRNMVTLWRETFGEKTAVIADFFPAGQITPSLPEQGSFYIAIHPEEEARKESLGRLHQGALAASGSALAVPGDRGSFPLPSGICSTVRCRDASLESLLEALRITKEGGAIILDFPHDADPSILQASRAFPHEVVENSGESTRKLVLIKRVLL